MSPLVLVLRPSPGAERTAAALAADGLRPILSPLLAFERAGRIGAADLAGAQALAFTSAAAVRALAEDLAADAALRPALDLPVYCVGLATALAAKEAGFQRVLAAQGDARALGRALSPLDPADGAVLHLCGADVAAPLAAAGGAEVRSRVVYRARPTDRLTEAAKAALAGPAAALVHSRRIAEALARALASTPPADLAVFAISARAAEPLASAPCRFVRLAAAPNDAALRAALGAWVARSAQSG